MKHALLLTLVLALGGCGLFGTNEGPKFDFNDYLGTAETTLITLANATRDACGNTIPDGPCLPGALITTSDKQQAKEWFGDAGAILDAIESGGSIDGESDKWALLGKAQAVIARLQEYLLQRGIE